MKEVIDAILTRYASAIRKAGGLTVPIALAIREGIISELKKVIAETDRSW